MTTEQKMREGFERDALEQGLDLTVIKITNGLYGYRSPSTQYYWMGYKKAWQAAQAQAVPDGWVLVPKEPTETMIDAAYHALLGKLQGLGLKVAYRAMLSAAPQPDKGE